MLLKWNLLECITFISCCGSFFLILLNYVTNISPITGILFPIYILSLFILSLTFSFKFIQWLMHLNKPFKYDLDRIRKECPYLEVLLRRLPRINSQVKFKEFDEEYKEYDTNELSVISTVLEKKLVSSWYVPYISQEIGFPFACKQMLDSMIGKTFQICNKIETKDVCIDMCSILASHLREYKKAMKRHQKTPEVNIESLYKKMHPTSDKTKNISMADHCTDILRVFLKELVSWELWDTPHSELLVRILAKKLVNFIETTITDPLWLNEKLLTLLNEKIPESNTDQIKKEVNSQEEKKEVKEDIVKENCNPEMTSVESALSTLITKTTAPILQRPINGDHHVVQELNKREEYEDIVEEGPVDCNEPVEIRSSPVMRQRRGRQGKNEVKIYDRIIEGSVKTWETDMDLQCISLGQDLLASLDGEITLSRLWEQDVDADGSPNNPARDKSPQPLWFGEEDAIDLELADSSPKEDGQFPKQHSPKTELLKDLQSTVHQAKSKIGDLQVGGTLPGDVACRAPGDEAAGMMEGLLDFGIAGLKKGLRFTGLSDDSQSQERSPSHSKEKSDERMSPPEARVKAAAEHREGGASSVIQREDNGGVAVPQLVKQQRVSSQDSVQLQSRSLRLGEDVPPAPAPLADSPEPQYEEAADLSTSIAKLRSLLQQRAAAAPAAPTHSGGAAAGAGAGGGAEAGGVVWAGAEETRGRTLQRPSLRPVDIAALADEYDMSAERNTPPGQASNNMQRLDKLFHRTVTGVFNSLRTAVGADEPGAPHVQPHTQPQPHAHPHGQPHAARWAYVCTSVELSVGCAVARLVGSRRALAVDAALDSLAAGGLGGAGRGGAGGGGAGAGAGGGGGEQPEPDELLEWCSERALGYCALAELAAAAGLLQAHLPHCLAALLLADVTESLVTAWLGELAAWLRAQVFVVFARAAAGGGDGGGSGSGGAGGGGGGTAPRPLCVEETCDALMRRLPGCLSVFGAERVRGAARLALGACSRAPLARDVALRALDALAAHFKRAAQRSGDAFRDN